MDRVIAEVVLWVALVMQLTCSWMDQAQILGSAITTTRKQVGEVVL